MAPENENLNEEFELVFDDADVITVPIDTTLSNPGEAADAKAVGDALALKADASSVVAITVNGEGPDLQGAILVDGTVYHGFMELGVPVLSPEGKEQQGFITVNGTEDDAYILRERPTRDSKMKARVYGEEVFPVYGSEEGNGGRLWYYIWVDGVWGWVAGGLSSFSEEK